MPIQIDIPKAKVITKDRLRADRTPLLAAQDILFMKAQEAGTSTTDIVTEKNRLRDITNQVDSMSTTDALKAATVTAQEQRMAVVVNGSGSITGLATDGLAFATGLGAAHVIKTNAQTINENITIPSTTNGVSAGPITVADNKTITVNGNWSIV